MKPLVVIGTPCYGGMVFQGYMESVIQLMGYASRNDFDVSLALLGGDSLITRSRNKLVSAFLDIPQATHLMFIDADISFYPEDVHRMLQFDHELVAGMYPLKNYDWEKAKGKISANADLDIEKMAESGLHFVGTPCPVADREHRSGFVTGIYAGTGFMLLRRSCLERMIFAYPDTKYNQAHVFSNVKEDGKNLYALFDCSIDPKTKTYLSEDFTFCNRWRAIGGKIWLDPRTRLTHYGTFKFQGNSGVVLDG